MGGHNDFYKFSFIWGGYIKFIILFLNFPTEFTICGKMPPNKGKFIKIIVTLVYGQFGRTLYQNMPKYFKFLRRKKNNKNNLFRHFSLRVFFYSEDPHELLLVSFFFNINYMNFYATFFIRSKSKENLKKKRFSKNKRCSGQLRSFNY